MSIRRQSLFFSLKFVYYSNNSDSVMEKWMSELFTSILNGETKAYSLNPNSIHNEFSEITNIKDKNEITFDYSYLIQIKAPDINYDDPYDIFDSLITETKVADHKKIVGFRFIEQWYRYGSGKIIKEVIAFAPLYYDKTICFPHPLFWIKEHKSNSHLELTVHYNVEIKQYRDDHNWFIANIPAPTRLLWMDDLFNDVKKGTISTYELSINNLLYSYNEIMIDEIHIMEKSKILIPYTGPDDYSLDVIETIVEYKIIVEPSDINTISFIEEWKFDKNGKFIKTVNSFAPISIKDEEKYLLFWIKNSNE